MRIVRARPGHVLEVTDEYISRVFLCGSRTYRPQITRTIRITEQPLSEDISRDRSDKNPAFIIPYVHSQEPQEELLQA